MRGRTFYRSLPKIILLLYLYAASSCGGGGVEPMRIEAGFSVGSVQELPFDSQGRAAVQFMGLTDSEKFSLVLLAANVNEGSFGIQIGSQNNNTLLPEALLQPPSDLLKEIKFSEDPTSSFHERLREEEAILGQVLREYPEDENKLLAAPSAVPLSAEPSIKALTAPSCANGAGIQIKVISSLRSTDSFDTICALIRHTSDNVIYVVEEAANANLPDDMLLPLVEEFESKIPLERRLLGKESDINGDGKFVVCFCAGVNRLGQLAGGFITGFFFGGDLFLENAVASSNGMEIIYVAVPDPNGVWGIAIPNDFFLSNIAPTSLPHEFQHMINFNQKALIRKVGAEVSWANEALSHLMEDLSVQTHLDQVSKENPSRVRFYLEAPEKVTFTAGTNIAQRGGAYLFFRYLCEQASSGRYGTLSDCDALLGNLLQSSFKGVENIEQATSLDFRRLLLDFFITLQLSNTGDSNNLRYNFRGIDLQAAQEDNRGTVLTGVRSQDFLGGELRAIINSPGGIFYHADGQSIILNGNFLSFTADPGMLPGGAIVRLE